MRHDRPPFSYRHPNLTLGIQGGVTALLAAGIFAAQSLMTKFDEKAGTDAIEDQLQAYNCVQKNLRFRTFGGLNLDQDITGRQVRSYFEGMPEYIQRLMKTADLEIWVTPQMADVERETELDFLPNTVGAFVHDYQGHSVLIIPLQDFFGSAIPEAELKVNIGHEIGHMVSRASGLRFGSGVILDAYMADIEKMKPERERLGKLIEEFSPRFSDSEQLNTEILKYIDGLKETDPEQHKKLTHALNVMFQVAIKENYYMPGNRHTTMYDASEEAFSQLYARTLFPELVSGDSDITTLLPDTYEQVQDISRRLAEIELKPCAAAPVLAEA